MNTCHKKRIIYLFAFLIAFFLTNALSQQRPESIKWLKANQPGLYRVIHVDDGDTITVDMNGLPERIRLIGIDTPELHHPQRPIECYAQEAKAYVKRFIGAQMVRLEADPLDDNRDLYGRLLRYVYLQDGRLLNSHIVKNGYGFAYTHFPFEKKQRIISLQKQAEKQLLGLWSKCRIYSTPRGYQTNPIQI